MAREKHLTEAVGLRIPARLKYGLELLGRQQNETMSALIIQGIEQMLEAGGISKKLDDLWADDPLERAKKLEEAMPDLMTDNERHAVTLLDFDQKHEAAARALLR